MTLTCRYGIDKMLTFKLRQRSPNLLWSYEDPTCNLSEVQTDPIIKDCQNPSFDVIVRDMCPFLARCVGCFGTAASRLTHGGRCPPRDPSTPGHQMYSALEDQALVPWQLRLDPALPPSTHCCSISLLGTSRANLERSMGPRSRQEAALGEVFQYDESS